MSVLLSILHSFVHSVSQKPCDIFTLKFKVGNISYSRRTECEIHIPASSKGKIISIALCLFFIIWFCADHSSKAVWRFVRSISPNLKYIVAALSVYRCAISVFFRNNCVRCISLKQCDKLYVITSKLEAVEVSKNRNAECKSDNPTSSNGFVQIISKNL